MMIFFPTLRRVRREKKTAVSLAERVLFSFHHIHLLVLSGVHNRSHQLSHDFDFFSVVCKVSFFHQRKTLPYAPRTPLVPAIRQCVASPKCHEIYFLCLISRYS